MAVSPDSGETVRSPGHALVNAPIDVTRPLLDSLLRTSARLSALADELDELRGKPLSRDARDRRDELLGEQREARTRFEHLELRLRTMRALAQSASSRPGAVVRH